MTSREVGKVPNYEEFFESKKQNKVKMEDSEKLPALHFRESVFGLRRLQTSLNLKTSRHFADSFSSNSNSIHSKIGKNDLHEKIIQIGDHLHHEIINKIKREYNEKLKEKEREFRELYEKEKKTFYDLEKVKYDAKSKQIKQAYKNEYEKMLKEKIDEIKAYYENLSNEKVEKCTIELKNEMQNTMLKINEDFERDKAESIEKAVNNQKKEEIENLEKQRHVYERKIEKLNQEWKHKMIENEKELREKLTEKFEKETCLREADSQWKKNLEFDQLKATFEKQLKLADIEYQKKIDAYSHLSLELKLAFENNETLKKKINAIREEFQACIERFSRLRKEEVEFLFPIETN